MICTCDQCGSAFCAFQLTALIKPKWYVLLYCCACLHPNTILMEAGWTTVPCPATNLSILICKSSARTKQSAISVALKTPLEIRLGIFIYKMLLLHRPDDYIGFTPICPPHILQQNCAHEHQCTALPHRTLSCQQLFVWCTIASPSKALALSAYKESDEKGELLRSNFTAIRGLVFSKSTKEFFASFDGISI